MGEGGIGFSKIDGNGGVLKFLLEKECGKAKLPGRELFMHYFLFMQIANSLIFLSYNINKQVF